MQKMYKNSEILHSIIPSGLTISLLPIKMVILCIFSFLFRADNDKYADQKQVFESVGL